MTLLYLDTSALVRVYTHEDGYQEVRREKAAASGDVTHEITYVEVHSAFASRRRRKLMREGHYQQAIQLFEQDWQQIRHVAIDPPLLTDAAQLSATHGLRAYDAVHLAAALALVPLGVRFMTFDAALRDVAAQVLPEVWQPGDTEA